MKNRFTFSLVFAVFYFSSFVIFSQETYREKPVSNNEVFEQAQSRIVRSGLEMPANFSLMHRAEKSAIDNKGTEFWLMMQRNYDTYVRGMYLDITSDVETSGNVSIPGQGFTQDFTATPGEITRITLPAEAQVTTSETIESKGIHIVANDEVAVYGLNLKEYTSDCFLSLPLDILSTQYLVMSYPNFTWTGISESTLGQFAMVSPYDNNQITITPTTSTYNGSAAGEPIQVTLNQGETYQLRTAYNNDPENDLTGSIIQSTLPVALFAGNSCASIPTNYSACDIIVEQIPPVSTWGNNFVTYPLEGRENGDTWRILSSQNNNEVYINGEYINTLNFGDFYETILTEPVTINSSKPVLVMQFSNGDDYDPGLANNGDPFMMLIPPEEQFMDAYTFATPSEGFAYNYVTITTPTEGISSLQLDGALVDPGWFTPIGSSGYSAAGIDIAVGSHTLVNTAGVPFGIYSYGFNGYDSYGYAGGLSLEFIYEGSAPFVRRTAATIQACQNNHTDDAEITIEVTADDLEEPYTQSVALFYASPPGEAYTRADMENTHDNVWSYTVSASNTHAPGLSFYFTATDGQLTSSDPQVDPSNNPYSLAILPNELPVISHEAVYHSDYSNDLLIVCDVSDNTDYVTEVALHYRTAGGNPVFEKVMMYEKGLYEAIIPGSNINENGTDYYITAKDNFGVEARFPTSEDFVKLNQGVGMAETDAETIGIQSNPNPFTNKMEIVVHLTESGQLEIALFDLTGKRLRLLQDRYMPSGNHYYTLKRGTLNPGTYLLTVRSGSAMNSKKITVK
ncbi:MAG: T9SS type A sorting domain-containing protein [Bacteroidota bacterium]